MTVLIVDDNPMLGQSLSNYLEASGHRCAYLQDSTLAIDWLDRNPCDTVIADMRMPEIDGLALTKLIRAKHPSLPILISTSLGREDGLVQAALKAGANGYLSKVSGPKLLLTTLLETAGQRVARAWPVAA